MSTPAPLPWYRHFWPWFIVGLLGISVVGSLATVYLAVSGRDPEVAGTWSKDAKSVVREDAPERRAQELGLGATIRIAEGAPRLRVALHGPEAARPGQLALRLVHPTLAQRDVEATLVRTAGGNYSALLPRDAAGRYQLILEGATTPGFGADGGTWRLVDRVDLEPGRAIDVGQAPSPPDRGAGTPAR